MLYYTAFYEMIYRPYILYWNHISLAFFLSLSLTLLPFIHIILDFASQTHNQIGLVFFCLCKKDFSCYNDMTNISYLDWLFRSR